MRTNHVAVATAMLLAGMILVATPGDVEAQGRGNQRDAIEVTGPTLSVVLQAEIRDFYAARPAAGVESLPPGIRRNLARGKPLPPGIAKKNVPAELRSRVGIADGYELVEVGLDVFLVEVATSIIHDVLMDVIR
jgi:hypothetical protein